MMKVLLPIVLVLTACASQREVAVLSTPADQPVVIPALDPVGSYEFITMVQGQTVTGTMTVTGTPGSYTGRIVASGIPEMSILSAETKGQNMIVHANMQGGDLVLDMKFNGANFTGTWALEADGGDFTGKKLPK